MKSSNILLVLITLLLVGGCVAFCVVFLVPAHQMRHQAREIALSPRTRLQETIRISRTPPPFYQVNEDVVGQTVLFDEKTVWSYTQGASTYQGQGFHVSPNEDYLVIENCMHAKPILVVKLKPPVRGPITVDAPKEQAEASSHDYVYPFGFVRWSDDSRFFIVEMEGTYVKEPRQFLAYRELWEVQPDSGKARRLHRQEQPWSERLVWTDP